MSPLDYITAPYRDYARFTGRASRMDYWAFGIFLTLVFFGLLFIFPTAGLAFFLFSFVPGLALAVRRLHDTGRTGWWMLLPGLTFPAWLFIFIVSAASALAVREDRFDDDRYFLAASAIMLLASLPILIWLLAPSEPGANAHGPNPHEVSR